MNTFLRTDDFDAWLSGLKDNVARARIVHRIRSAEYGNFGDCETVGEGVSEMRIHVGPSSLSDLKPADGVPAGGFS